MVRLNNLELNLSNKFKILFLVFNLFFFKATYSQCTNPEPTATSTSVTFCVLDYTTVSDLVLATGTVGGQIVWFDAPTSGNQYDPADVLETGIYYADDIVAGGCSVSRLAINVTVNGSLDRPINFSFTTELCESNNPTVGQLYPVGTNNAWYDSKTGGNLLSESDPLVDGEIYWLEQTENGCKNERFATEFKFLVVADPTVTVAQEIQKFCSSQNPTIADLVATADSLTWYSSLSSQTPIPFSTPLINGQDYWATNSNPTFGCEGIKRVKVDVIVEEQPNAGENAQYDDCELFFKQNTVNLFDKLDGNPQTGGTWTGPSSLSGGYLGTFDGNIHLEGVYTYTITSTTGICTVDDAATLEVIFNKTTAPTTTNTTQEFCSINAPTIANLQATGTAIKWYATATSTIELASTAVLVDGENYFATQTNTTTGCESSPRLEVTVQINTTAAPTTTNTVQEFCDINASTIADLQATGSSIKWYESATSTVELLSTEVLVDGEDYFATQTNATTGCESISRLEVTVNINTTTAPTTTNLVQEFCEIESSTVADLQATGTSIKWYENATSTVELLSTEVLIDGEDYFATQTNGTTGCESISRLEVTVKINKTLAPTTTNSVQEFCEIVAATVGDLQATGTDIKWYESATSNVVLTSTDVLVDGENYFATQTNGTTGCESSSRLEVTVNINSTNAPTSTNAIQEFCDVDVVTIADLQATGTGIKWYESATSTVQLSSTEVLVDGEDYFATQTTGSNGCESSSRLKITVKINTTPAPTTTNSVQEFCDVDEATIADLQATGSSIKWYESATSTVELSSTEVLVDGENYYATQTNGTSGCESSSRLEVTVNINSTTAPTTANDVQEFCEIVAATVGDLQVIGTDIKWYESATSTVELLPTEVLVDGENYFATQTNATTGCESLSRLEVNVTIKITTAPTTANTVQEFCDTDVATIADLQATGTDIKWYATATSTIVLPSTNVLVDGENYFATQTNTTTGCESATRLEVTVNLNGTPPIPTTTNIKQEFCDSSNATIADLQATGTDIKWYESVTSTIALASTEALVDGEDYFATQTNTSGCESLTRLEVTVVINASPLTPTTTNATQEFCDLSNATIADLQATGTDIKWYESATSTTALASTELLIDGEDYFATQTNTSGCESDRLLVTVTFNTVEEPELLTFDGDQFCSVNNPTLADLENNIAKDSNNTYVWYDSYPNGTVLNLTTLLEESTTYYLIATNSSGCDSNPLQVTPSLDACDNEDIITYDGFSPTGDGINDTFHIENIDVLYPNYTIEFFNRWGNIVYKGNASKPEWNGKLNGTGEYLPVGVYYYIIYFNKNNRKPIQNKLYLSR